MQVYHATDQSCIQPILDNGFLYRPSKKHWLGNGIYFYQDYQLAEWWATNPTKTFDVDIKKPAILSVDIQIPDENILDLRKLSDYADCIQAYMEFRGYALQYLENNIWHDRNRLRCSFFDWVFETREVSCIIGNFTHPHQAYLRSSPQTALEQMRLFYLPFTETQICVLPRIIKRENIKVMDLGGNGND